MSDPDMVMYCDMTREINRNTKVVKHFLSRNHHALYNVTTIETIDLYPPLFLVQGSVEGNPVRLNVFQPIHDFDLPHWYKDYTCAAENERLP